MPRALVTGGSGLLGFHIVRRLRELGWETRALVRSQAGAGWLAESGAILVGGDICQPDIVRDAARECDVIFHCAATIASLRGWDEYFRTNVEGTRNIVEAARTSGARMVHASSVAVYGAGSRYRADGLPTTEDTPLAPLNERDFYARSKREAEQLVLDAHRSGAIWACALRPDIMYGERDRHFIPRAARLISGFAPVVGTGDVLLPIIHAGNVADAALLAATSEVAGGKVYNVAHDFDVSYLEFVQLAAQGLDREVTPFHVPRWVAAMLARALELAARTPLLAGLPIPASNSVEYVTRDNPFSSELAHRELGWKPRQHPADTVPAAFRWWKHHSIAS